MFKSFHGGIHPKDNKQLSSEVPIEIAPIPKKVVNTVIRKVVV